MPPLISRNRDETVRRRSVPPRPEGIRVPAIGEIQACHSTRPSCASNAFHSAALVGAERRVSSVAPLTVCWRIDVPALLQSLADLRLRERFLLRKIFARITWLAVPRYKLHRLHILRFPIEIE